MSEIPKPDWPCENDHLLNEIDAVLDELFPLEDEHAYKLMFQAGIPKERELYVEERDIPEDVVQRINSRCTGFVIDDCVQASVQTNDTDCISSRLNDTNVVANEPDGFRERRARTENGSTRLIIRPAFSRQALREAGFDVGDS